MWPKLLVNSTVIKAFNKSEDLVESKNNINVGYSGYRLL